MKLFIKHMVCLRCKLMAIEILKYLGFECAQVELGMIEITKYASPEKLEQLRTNLLTIGLELMTNPKAILIEKIKTLIIDIVHHSDELPILNYSAYLSQQLGHRYSYLANVFTEEVGMTIHQFIIMQKVEQIKELLLNDDLNLTEISYKLHYSSVAHLSNQFKKSTGFTPSFFKTSNTSNRIAIDLL